MCVEVSQGNASPARLLAIPTLPEPDIPDINESMIDRRLTHVVATARHGSFTAAANKVGVTQSAITKSIGELERQIGYLIFNRTARGVTLTEDGRVFVERTARLLDDANELLRGRSVSHDPYAGMLRIGVCPASLVWLLVEPISLLLSRHPNIRLDISGASFERMVQQLHTGAVDVVLGMEAAFSERPDFRREPLEPLRTTLFARRGHPITECAHVTEKELAQYDFVSPSDSRPYGTAIRDIFESQEIDATTRIHIIDEFSIVKRIVANTDAIGVVGIPYTLAESFTRKFVRVPYFESFPLAPLCCAVRSRWEARPAVRAFLKACRECRPIKRSDVPDTAESLAPAYPGGAASSGPSENAPA